MDVCALDAELYMDVARDAATMETYRFGIGGPANAALQDFRGIVIVNRTPSPGAVTNAIFPPSACVTRL